MTRPMSEEERERILQWAQRFADDCAAPGSTPPLYASGDAMLDVCLALLANSASERGLREALAGLLDLAIEVRIEGTSIVLFHRDREAARERLAKARAALSPKGEEPTP